MLEAIWTLDAYSFIRKRPTVQNLDLHWLVNLATRAWLRRSEMLAKWTARAVRQIGEVLQDIKRKNNNLRSIHVILSSTPIEGGSKKMGLLRKFSRYLYRDGLYCEVEKAFLEVTKACIYGYVGPKCGGLHSTRKGE